MKKLILSLLLLSSVVSLRAQNADKAFSISCSELSFDGFSDLIFKKSGVRVYYKTEWTKDLKVSLQSNSITASVAVDSALRGTNLDFCLLNGNLVLFPKGAVITSLPKYDVRKGYWLAGDSTRNQLTGSEERYLTGRKADVAQIITVGKKNGPIVGTKAQITGRIIDEDTGEPVFSATVKIAETRTGAVSDINGYVLLLLAKGKYNVQVDILGYSRIKYQLEVLSDGEFSIPIRKSVIQMKEIVVFGDRQMNIRSKDPGLDKMSIKAIKELPAMMGERDILKVSGTLPGIVSVGEGSAGLNVRGGGSDQNAFYINKIPIYNTSHLFGFFPAFNADVIKDFSIYKGHIPAQYGGHLSSVFNIVARQGNRKRFTARGGISPVTGNLVVEGPVVKEVSSFILSVRSSYSDWILKKIEDPDINSSSARFNDISGGLNVDLRKTQISVFGYRSYDKFRLSDLNSYEYSNTGFSATAGHSFGNSLRSEISLVGSGYDFSTTDMQEAANAYEHSYSMEHYEAKIDFKHVISAKHTFDYGLNAILYKLNRGNVLAYGDNSLRKTVELGKEQGLESSVYFSDAWEILPWMNLTAGFRYALYAPLGPKIVYLYAEGLPVDQRFISDSLNFLENQLIKKYFQPDFRMALNLTTDESGSIKLAFNQMHQNLFLLNTTAAIAPNTQWKLSDYHLLPSESNQISAGVFRTFAGYGLETSAEFFYKKTSNYPEFRDGADFLNNPLVETATLQGDQTAWGIEFFVKRSLRKVEGWLSYTYSRSFVTINGGQDWNQINGGETYPANFDIPHVVNLVLSYHITRRVTLATIITYQSGKPVTYPVSIYYVNGFPVLDYSQRNAYRIPDYFRSDLSLTVEGNLKKRKLLHSSFVLSVYNATGRDNPYSVYYKTESGNIRSYQYSVISVPVFTATWLFKLGNYATE